jgi:hypothetical protein
MYGRRYAVELGLSLATYLAFLMLMIWYLRHHPGAHDAPATLVCLLPMLPLAGSCWAILRQLQRIDELQRRIQLEGLAISFAATALLTFSYGFLEIVGFPKLSMFCVWPLMATFWVAGCAASYLRYR